MAVATYFITAQDIPRTPAWFNAHLASVLAGDLLLTSTMAYFLLGSRRRAIPQSEPGTSDLLRAMLQLIVSMTFTTEKALFSVAFNMPLPRLHAVSMIFMLNARRHIRLVGV
ncbi:hypothetical protein B0H14DRAFT_2782060 [Mycena olivaceomarginata]|nr:hypothetical protein B0H14DRAFT_2782060 [Mycena olivaceomarginata]